MIWTLLANYPLITYPAKGLVCALGISIVLGLKKNKRPSKIILLSSFSLLYIFSLSNISRALMYSLEKTYAMEDLSAQIHAADAVVALGGNSIEFQKVDLEKELLKPTHRLTTAIKLLKSGFARYLLISGGEESNSFNEVSLSSNLAKLSGLKDKQILTGTLNTNTLSEAHFIGQKTRDYKWKRVIIVTSAYHMKRALFTIKNQTDAALIPVAVDFKKIENNELTGNSLVDAFIPSFAALNESTRAIKEYTGIAYAWLFIHLRAE